MGRVASIALVVGTMAVIIIALDVLFFRHHFWPRLAANVGVVLLVGAFFFRFRGDL